MRREDAPWSLALAAATAAMTKFMVPRGGRTGCQGTREPHAVFSTLQL